MIAARFDVNRSLALAATRSAPLASVRPPATGRCAACWRSSHWVISCLPAGTACTSLWRTSNRMATCAACWSTCFRQADHSLQCLKIAVHGRGKQPAGMRAPVMRHWSAQGEVRSTTPQLTCTALLARCPLSAAVLELCPRDLLAPCRQHSGTTGLQTQRRHERCAWPGEQTVRG